MTGVLSQLSKEMLQHFQRWENAQKTNGREIYLPCPQKPPYHSFLNHDGIPCRAFLQFPGVLTHCAAVALGEDSNPGFVLSTAWRSQWQPAVRAHCGSSFGSAASRLCQLWVSPLAVLRAVVRLLSPPASSPSLWAGAGRAGWFLFGVPGSHPGSEPCPAPTLVGLWGHRRVPRHRTWPVGSQAGSAQWDLGLSHCQHCGCHQHRAQASVTSRHESHTNLWGIKEGSNKENPKLFWCTPLKNPNFSFRLFPPLN